MQSRLLFIPVPQAGFISNRFIEDLNLIYELKSILKLNKHLKINL